MIEMSLGPVLKRDPWWCRMASRLFGAKPRVYLYRTHATGYREVVAVFKPGMEAEYMQWTNEQLDSINSVIAKVQQHGNGSFCVSDNRE